jgi:uncharacterized RDD family membrane protein YckC
VWHFEDDGRASGPLSFEEIRRLIDLGRITWSTRVWREGFADWAEAGTTELAPLFHGAPPPPAEPFAAQPPSRPYPASAGPASPARVIPFAGFWIRLAAYIIDFAIIQVTVGIASFTLGIVIGVVGVASKMDQQGVQSFAGILGGLVGVVLTLLYYSRFPASRWQATPGKRLLNLYIIRTDGKRVGAWLALGRYFAYFLSGLPLGVGFLMILWSDQKKGLHDIVCDTRVVYGKPTASEDIRNVFA